MHAVLQRIEKDEVPLAHGHHIEASQRILDEKAQKDELYREYRHFQARFSGRLQSKAGNVKSFSPDDIVVGACLREATDSHLFLCTLRVNNQRAVARVHSARAMARQIWHEVSIWSEISHPNIVPLLGVTMGEGQVVTVSEFCDEGSLYDANARHLRHLTVSPSATKSSSLASPKVAHRPSFQLVAWAEGLASALSYLHALTPTPVIHRNLKSSNCMLSHGGSKLLLSDFTTACLGRGDPSEDLTPQVGSIRWMAPEVLVDKPYGPPADMYAFGMVCYEMASYQVPFADSTTTQACLRACAGQRPTVPTGCPEWLQALMVAAWRPEPEARPDFASTHATLSALKKTTLAASADAARAFPFFSARLGALSKSYVGAPAAALLGQKRPWSPSATASSAPSAAAAMAPAAAFLVAKWASQAPTAGNASGQSTRPASRTQSFLSVMDAVSLPRRSTSSPEAASPPGVPPTSMAFTDMPARSTPITAPASPPGQTCSRAHATAPLGTAPLATAPLATAPLAVRPASPAAEDAKMKDEDCAMAILQISRRAAFQQWMTRDGSANV